MDYAYLKDIDLYKNLVVLRKRTKTASKKLQRTLELYGDLANTMADVAQQSKREIGLLSRLKNELSIVNRNLYYYRPQKRTLKRMEFITSELSDAHTRNRQHGRNDLRKDLSKEKSDEALNIINSAFDDIEDVLLLPGLLHEISERKGLYDNYIGDRWWQVMASTLIATLTGIVGLLIGILAS